MVEKEVVELVLRDSRGDFKSSMYLEKCNTNQDKVENVLHTINKANLGKARAFGMDKVLIVMSIKSVGEEIYNIEWEEV